MPQSPLSDVRSGHNVSRETRARLDILAAQLEKWQPRINLVSSATMPEFRTRHIADSLQLWTLAPDARRWIDLGSGGGFPGLVIAACLAEHSDGQITLVESNAKKCAFLRETARLASLPATVICGRIETVVPGLRKRFDVVTARALTSLTGLLAFSEPLIASGAIGLFPKGQDVDDEIKVALRDWNFSHDLIQSQTELRGRIVLVRSSSRL